MTECVPEMRKPTLDNRWLNQHERHVSECKEGEPDVLLIGDSIIQQMLYHKFWNELICPLHPLNLGIGGDTIQNVLWRIENGELGSINPKVVVVHVGTNNVSNTPQEICRGIMEVLRKLRVKLPEAHIIFWGLLPRGEYPNKVCDKNSIVNEFVKRELHKSTSLQLVEIICTGEILRNADERKQINKHDLFDFLHPTEAGYKKLFSPVLDRIREVLANHFFSNALFT